MKNRKLLVRVACTTKEFYLSPPPPNSNDWHIRFTPPRSVRDKLGIRERINRTTGKAEIEPAKHVARQIIESYWNADALPSVKERNTFAELPEIVARYRTGARTIADKEELAASTINKNVTSFIRVTETRWDDASRERRLNWQHLTADCLTPELLHDFKRGWLARIDHADLQAMSSAKHTVNAYIRQARSLFADEYMPLYRDLVLPDLAEFRKVKLFKTAGTTRYVPIPQATIDAMETEIRSLRTERSDLYLAFYFMLLLGMRVSEVRQARLEWIEEWPVLDPVTKSGQVVALMSIKRRAYYKPKGIDGAVTIAPWLLEDIHALSGAVTPMDYLIPAANPTARHDVLRRELSAIVRRHLGSGRRKTCHELRKHAVSLALMQYRNYVDALKFSRHSDVRTLRNHYEGFLDHLSPITSSNWRTA